MRERSERIRDTADPTEVEYSRVERRYRLVLRMLPRWYRDDRAEEMTATFLAERTDRVDLEYSWPGWAETASVAALAVRTRLAGDRGPERAQAWGHAVRLVALLGLLGYAAGFAGWHAAFAATQVGKAAGWRGWLGVLYRDPVWPAVTSAAFSALVAVAFIVLLLGRRAAAVTLALVGAAGLLLTRLVLVAAGDVPWTQLANADLLLLVCVPVGCLALGFHREAPAVTHPQRWLAAAAALALAGALLGYAGAQSWLPYGIEAAPWALAVGIVAVLTSPLLAPIRRSPGWTAALAIGALLLAVAGLQNTYYAAQIGSQDDPDVRKLVAVLAAQAAVMSVAAVVMAVAAARALRRVPSGRLGESTVNGI